MRILFVARSSLYSHPGGDTVHLEQTMQHLRKRGHQAEFYQKTHTPRDFDLFHFFNLGQPAPLLPFLSYQKPIVISSLWVDYATTDEQMSALRRFLLRLLGPGFLEYLKTWARVLKGQEGFPPFAYFWRGHRGSIEKILKHCSYVLTATEYEWESLRSRTSYRGPGEVLRPGVEHLPKVLPANERRGVACVARIEPLKNQAGLIGAAALLGQPLFLAGSASRNHGAYYQRCRKKAGAEVSFLGQLPDGEVADLLARVQVHALPSFFETTGLSTLEAFASGCQVVVSDHPIQRELWGDRAHYARPDDAAEIAHALALAHASDRDHREWLGRNFSWAQAAQRLAKIYQSLT